MAKLTRLKIPAFDLTWHVVEDESIAFIPGGGGSAKSGVKNQIQFGQIGPDYNMIYMASFETDTETQNKLCSGVSCGKFEAHFAIADL